MLSQAPKSRFGSALELQVLGREGCVRFVFLHLTFPLRICLVHPKLWPSEENQPLLTNFLHLIPVACSSPTPCLRCSRVPPKIHLTHDCLSALPEGTQKPKAALQQREGFENMVLGKPQGGERWLERPEAGAVDGSPSPTGAPWQTPVARDGTQAGFVP